MDDSGNQLYHSDLFCLPWLNDPSPHFILCTQPSLCGVSPCPSFSTLQADHGPRHLLHSSRVIQQASSPVPNSLSPLWGWKSYLPLPFTSWPFFLPQDLWPHLQSSAERSSPPGSPPGLLTFYSGPSCPHFQDSCRMGHRSREPMESISLLICTDHMVRCFLRAKQVASWCFLPSSIALCTVAD